MTSYMYGKKYMYIAFMTTYEMYTYRSIIA